MKIKDIFKNKTSMNTENTDKDPIENETENVVNEVETAEEIEAEETIEDVKAEGRKLVAEVVAAVDSKKMKEWAHHYTTNIFTYSKDEEKIRTLRDKLKNEKESIIAQFKKAYKL